MINFTQTIGAFAFLIAALASVAARPQPWRLVALAHGGFALEVLLGARHRLHDAAILLAGNGYAGRRPLQALAVVMVAAGAIAFARILVRRERVMLPYALAAGIVVLLASLFVIESISLHWLDAVFYHPAGGLPIIAWLWLLGAGLAAVCGLASRSAA